MPWSIQAAMHVGRSNNLGELRRVFVRGSPLESFEGFEPLPILIHEAKEAQGPQRPGCHAGGNAYGLKVRARERFREPPLTVTADDIVNGLVGRVGSVVFV
jgi:hypothetical protein